MIEECYEEVQVRYYCYDYTFKEWLIYIENTGY